MIRRRKVLIGRGSEAEKVFKVKFYRGKRRIGTLVEKVYRRGQGPVEILIGEKKRSPHFKMFGKWVVAVTPEGCLAIMRGRASEKGPFAKIFGGYADKKKAVIFQEYARGKPADTGDLDVISGKFSHLVDLKGSNVIKTKEGYKIVDFMRETTFKELEKNICSKFSKDLSCLKGGLRNFLKRKTS